MSWSRRAAGCLLGWTGDYGVILLVLLATNALTLVMWTAEYAARALTAARPTSTDSS